MWPGVTDLASSFLWAERVEFQWEKAPSRAKTNLLEPTPVMDRAGFRSGILLWTSAPQWQFGAEMDFWTLTNVLVGGGDRATRLIGGQPVWWLCFSLLLVGWMANFASLDSH